MEIKEQVGMLRLKNIIRTAKEKIEGVISSDSFKIFIFLLVLYMATMKTLPLSDTQPNNWLPIILLRERTINFNMFQFAENNYLFYQSPAGSYSIFGLGTPLLALPFFLPTLFMGQVSNFTALLLGKIAASTIAALSAVFIYLAARRLSNRKTAIITSLIFGIATNMFAMTSQMLLSFTGAILCVSIGLYCLVSRNEKPGRPVIAGVAFAWAGMCQPVMFLIFLIFGLYVLITKYRDVIWYAIGGIPLIILTALYQWASYGSPLRTGEFLGSAFLMSGSKDWGVSVPALEMWSTPLFKGIAGTTISPSRGLFVWSPILIFALLGLILVFKKGWKSKENILFFCALSSLLIILTASKWWDWVGSNSWGYRITISTLPFLCLLLVPAIDFLKGKKLLQCVFIVLLAFSVFVQLAGYICYDGGSWEFQVQGRQKDGQAKYWSVANGQLAWTLDNFYFYKSKFWQRIAFEPIKLEIKDVQTERKGADYFDVILEVDSSQICEVNIRLSPGDNFYSTLEGSEFVALLPRGLNTIELTDVEATEENVTLYVNIYDENGEIQSMIMEEDIGKI